MSTFLILPLGLLLGGAIISLVLARFRPRYSADAAAISSTLSLIAWVIAGRNLPIAVPGGESQSVGELALWSFSVDEPAWWVSFSLLLILASSLLIMVTASRVIPTESRASARRRSAAAAGLLITIAVLLSIWGKTLPTIASGWTLIAGGWAFLVWAARKGPENSAIALSRVSAMLVSLFFLGLAAASQPNLSLLTSSPETWSAQARTWAMLAAVVLTGAFPFHMWRPSPGKHVIGADALINIAPSIAGAYFLAKLASTGGDSSALYTILLTSFGLLGIVYCVNKCWSNLDNRLAVVQAIAVSQISLILLSAAWTNTETVILFVRGLALSAGGLFLAVTWPVKTTNQLKIPLWILAAGFVGIPVMANFIGLSSLYGSQINSGKIVLAILTAVIVMPLFAAAVLLVWEEGKKKRPIEMSGLSQARIAVAYAIPAIGIVAVPLSSQVLGDAKSWIMILASAMGAAGISWYTSRNPEIRNVLRGAFRIPVPLGSGQRIVRSIADGANLLMRETASILEGEGGMLWLLVLAVILWLVRIV
jgi:hypothetical protein